MAAAPGGRLVFIDRLRTLLTVLVIAHHTAITYGGSGGWFYREVTDSGVPFSLLLTLFCSVNQAFFMGLFFLLAGYFTPPALAAKGLRRFITDRLLRLGLPLLVFGLVLGPLAVALAGIQQGRPFWARWLGLMEHGVFFIGPLWFAWALLLFLACWLAWRLTHPPVPPPATPLPVPGDRAWVLAALAVGAAALAMRQWVPVGENRWGLQLGYFASYVFLFALGCAAWRHRWLERVDRAQARRWGRVALYTVPLLVATAAATGALAGQAVNFNSGLGVAAVVYAFWEPFVAWGVIARLLVGFQARPNTPHPRWQRWDACAYGAFILHAPVLTGLAVAVAGWGAPPVLKFCLVLVGATLASFMLAAALRRLPGARRVL
ncbi:MAG: acyltransferase family protein [Aquabacterium sp.]|nr:acyltransferase family protein [Aquabacterium sp.]